MSSKGKGFSPLQTCLAKSAIGEAADTRQIFLHTGQVALVDAADYEWLMRVRWYASPAKSGAAYAASTRPLAGTSRRMHRAIMLPPEDMEVDHINGNTLDNRRANLRICTSAQNLWWRGAYSNRRATIYRGLQRRGLQWRARVAANGVRYSTGWLYDEVEAALAYDALARKHHGVFARVNFPNAAEQAVLSGARS